MSKATNGWAGANVVSDVGYCNLCQQYCLENELRYYHGPDGVHVMFCSECADKVGDGYHGCGCGG